MKNKNMMQIAALAAVLGAPGLVFAADASSLEGMEAGTTAEAISDTLTAEGYEVRKVETEDGMLEAYAMKDGKRYEIYVDPASGKVAKVEED